LRFDFTCSLKTLSYNFFIVQINLLIYEVN
jgi:hypothetical protein